jgi:F0F1-type ATP synthase assembly protein I
VNQQGRRGQRLALKFAAVQMACAGVAAVVSLAIGDFNSFRSASVGGLIVAIGTVVFAWRLFADTWPAADAAKGFFVGGAFKWIWTIGALWLALSYGEFDALWLLIGLIAAQSGFWIAMRMFK